MFFFFFKQKTAYELRISDWSSDVCSSDLPLRAPDVRYEPTPQSVAPRILNVAAVRAGDVVYDLGSGDGRIVIAAARDRGAQGVGIDIDPTRIADARATARAAGPPDQVSFRNQHETAEQRVGKGWDMKG